MDRRDDLLADCYGIEESRSDLGIELRVDLPPRLANLYERVSAAVRDALARKGEMQPFRIDGPIELDLRLRNRFMAEWLNYLDGIERLDAYSIRYRSADILGVWRFLTFLTFARSVIR